MSNRNQIVNFMSDYLEVEKFKDYCLNGLQVEGKQNIKKIITGVSLNLELIDQAIVKKADMILVHHGLFNKNIFDEFIQIKGVWRERLKKLLVNDINLAGYHLPLDAHPIVGNNILLLKKLGLKKQEKIGVGWVGKYDAPVKLDEIVAKLDKMLKTKSYVIRAGADKIQNVGIVSGGSSTRLPQAVEAGLDLYICGDVQEGIVDVAKECKINLINAGHYRTEKFGVQALGELVGKKFGVEVEFVEIDNEI